jgi:hypothetical protein
MKKFVLSLTFVVLFAGQSFADFMAWSSETEDDPFSKGQRVTVDFMSTIRSGIILICDSSEQGLLLRAIPGFAFDNALAGAEPEIEIAIDGERIVGQTGETGSVGDNLATAQVMLTGENAEVFLEAFEKAKKQVAIKDGISDRPHLLSARGSSKTSKALRACLGKQSK